MYRDKLGHELVKDDAVLMPFIEKGKEHRLRMRVRTLYTTGTGVDEAQLSDGEGRDFCVRCDQLEKVGTLTPEPETPLN